MIKTEDYFEEKQESSVWKHTKIVGSLLRKREVVEDLTSYKVYFACKVCGIRFERYPFGEVPNSPLLFKEMHALRHQVAGEFPQEQKSR